MTNYRDVPESREVRREDQHREQEADLERRIAEAPTLHDKLQILTGEPSKRTRRAMELFEDWAERNPGPSDEERAEAWAEIERQRARERPDEPAP